MFVSEESALAIARAEIHGDTKGQLDATESAIVKKAVECQVKTAEAAVSYMELCQLVHDAKLLPKVTRALLLAGGLPSSRVSEIQTIAQSSNEIFKSYVNRMIGFKVALEAARGAKRAQLELDAVPKEAKATLHELIPSLLGDRKRFTAEVEGVKIMIVRQKPAKEVKEKGGK